MDALGCRGCKERDARIAELEGRVAALEARLNTNATNSSTPPSANPLGAEKPVKKKRSKRKRGAQPKHPPHLKELLPPEQVTHFEPIIPKQCAGCGAALPATAGPGDPEPKRFQTIDLPPVVLEVVEYQAHARTCACCGEVTTTTIPADLRAHSIGPRLTGVLSYLTGNFGLSKRNVEDLVADIFGAEISVGTVANLEQEVSAALAPAHQEALLAVQQAPVKFVDETSWKLWGTLCWLWAAATTTVAAFVIHAKRNAAALAVLLGEEIDGIVHSDRYSVYWQVPSERRQVCWAHLKRDFQKIVDQGGPSVFVGRRGLRIVKEAFAAWHQFQEGKVTRPQLQQLIEPLERRLNKALVEGVFGDDARVQKFCDNLIDLGDALWTFAYQEGVEPTNNFIERLLRRAVLWRKRSFGCNSERGCRFVERILTVAQTCSLRGRNVLDYLHAAVSAHRQGQPHPILLGER